MRLDISDAQLDRIRSQLIAAIEHELAQNERHEELSAQFDRGYQSGMQYVLVTFGLIPKMEYTAEGRTLRIEKFEES